jgi:hypothetical protein
MHSNMTRLLMCVLCLYMGIAKAQTPVSGIDLLKDINERLRKCEAYYYEVNVQGFSIGNANAPVYNSTSISLRDKDNYYVRGMGKTTIMTPGYSLLLDTRQRIIMYKALQKGPLNLSKVSETAHAVSVDTLLKIVGIKADVIVNNDNVVVLKLSNVGAGVSNMQLSFDKKMNYIRRLEYVYDPMTQKETGNSKVVVNYKTLTATKAGIEEMFNLKNYMTKNKGNWISVRKYSGYKIVDQTNADF